MERLRNMELKKAFFLITCACLILSFLLVVWIKIFCDTICAKYAMEGISIYIEEQENDTRFQIQDRRTSQEILPKDQGEHLFFQIPASVQQWIVSGLDSIWILSCILIPTAGMAAAGILFYRLKLEKPIQVLKEGTKQIQNHNLDFQVPIVSNDELGQLCCAFEMMRTELLWSNQELWQQAEERKRLNAAFSHDLRNPITVLKGTVKMLRQGIKDEQAIERLECYTLRIEQYVEVMSRIQRLDQMPLRIEEVAVTLLETELKESVSILGHGILAEVAVCCKETVWIDHGILLTVAENLIGNSERYAQKQMVITLEIEEGFLILTVADDGQGYPVEVIRDGGKPFGKVGEGGEHFGMGLYSCQVLCRKHGGRLQVGNLDGGGAVATASFQMGSA